MRTSSYLRILGFLVIALLLFEFIVDSGEAYAFVQFPIIWAILGFVALFAVATEFIVAALKSVLFKSLDEQAQERYVAKQALKKKKQFAGVKRTYSNLLGSKPLMEEHEIILDHNYDGIKELDNNLPPWWVYMFYATIVFAVVYLVRYHVYGDSTQAQEYEIAVAEARVDIANYKKTAKNLVDINTVELLTEASDLAAGKSIFAENCVACHKADGGGGIGPNLTDEYWILGGGIKNVFNTISEGGRDGKGMVSWKSELKPLEMAQVSSYLLGFQGTTPAEPKAAEGDVWIDPDATLVVPLTVSDSTKVDTTNTN